MNCTWMRHMYCSYVFLCACRLSNKVLLLVLLLGTFACRWVVHFHYEIDSFSSHYLPSYNHIANNLITFLASIFIFMHAKISQLDTTLHDMWADNLLSLKIWKIMEELVLNNRTSIELAVKNCWQWTGNSSLAWPDHFFPFVLGRPNTEGKKRSGHARLRKQSGLIVTWLMD